MAATCNCKPLGYLGWIYHVCKERNRGLPVNRRMVDVPGHDPFEVYFCPVTKMFGGTAHGPHHWRDPTCSCMTPPFTKRNTITINTRTVDGIVVLLGWLFASREESLCTDEEYPPVATRRHDADRQAAAKKREKKLARKYRGR